MLTPNHRFRSGRFGAHAVARCAHKNKLDWMESSPVLLKDKGLELRLLEGGGPVLEVHHVGRRWISAATLVLRNSCIKAIAPCTGKSFR